MPSLTSPPTSPASLPLPHDSHRLSWPPPLACRHLDGGSLLYVGSPSAKVVGAEGEGGELLAALMDHAASPPFTHYHAWDAGDVVVWDNTQTLHRSFPFDNDGSSRRELYRTQARVRLGRGQGWPRRDEL